jgi:beta-mannanase
MLLLLSTFTIQLHANRRISWAEKGCWTGAFVSWKTVDDGMEYQVTTSDIKATEAKMGKHLAIIADYRAFLNNNQAVDFPIDFFNRVKANDSILFLTWEPRDWQDPNRNVLPEILAGKMDDYIDRFAKAIQATRSTILLRFGQEMNLQNFPWNGLHNGAGETTGFGDPKLADGPERYAAAYRYIYARFERLGVRNLYWVWTPVRHSVPDEPWNAFQNYFPGTRFVDLIALDEYNWGNTQSWSHWTPFWELYNDWYVALLRMYPDKYFMIGEFSSAEGETPEYKPEWIRQSFNLLRARFKEIKAFIWFDVDNREATVNGMAEKSDWRMDSSELSLKAIQESLANPYYKERVF